MQEDFIQPPVCLSHDECLSSSLADQLLNFDHEDDSFEEAMNSSKVSHLTNNVFGSSDVPVANSSQAIDNTIDLASYDNSFDPDLISALLNPQPPPEPDILPTLSGLSMAPIHHTDEFNTMTCNPPFTSYPPNSVLNQLPLDPLGLPGYLSMDPSAMQHCPFLDANSEIGEKLYPDEMAMPTCGVEDEMGMYAGDGMPMRSLEATGASFIKGMCTYGVVPRVYNPRNLQVIGDNQHIMARCSTNTNPLQVPSDIPATDDSNYKACRLSVEEKKEKIDKYLRKRKARNFSKTIKYACRKTLADRRPRVRGRFAKNDEFSEVLPEPNSFDGGYDDVEIGAMNDEDLLDSSDILAHISGVNSFGFHCPVESWI